jgi:hypothetical protein
MSYTFITEFVFVINCISFPCRGDDPSFINNKLHSISSTPTVKGISSRLSKRTISLWCEKFYQQQQIKKISRVFKRNAEVINKYIKQQWLKDRL